MSGKTYTERTLETLVELTDLQRKSIEALRESLSLMNTQLGDRIGELSLNLAQSNSLNNEVKGMIRQQSQNIDRLTQTVERLALSIDGHLQVAQQQSANIAELTKLVTAQANTVNRLLDRMVA